MTVTLKATIRTDDGETLLSVDAHGTPEGMGDLLGALLHGVAEAYRAGQAQSDGTAT